MNCPIKTQENTDWLLDYSAGRLNEEHAVVLERHVEMCVQCAEFVLSQQGIWSALDDWQPAPVSADFNRRLYQRIDGGKPAPWIRRIFRPLETAFWRPAVPVAAACLMIAAGLLLRTPQVKVTPTEPQARVEPEQVERAVDDMMMLHELNVTSQSDQKTFTPKSM
ncbi:MAG: hypothetical protein DMG58_14850 [Acidobacteria bacterium]|nr:MAG: hypothetical protein DMG58_14850 [Acidobacteriota bacterium]